MNLNLRSSLKKSVLLFVCDWYSKMPIKNVILELLIEVVSSLLLSSQFEVVIICEVVFTQNQSHQFKKPKIV